MSGGAVGSPPGTPRDDRVTTVDEFAESLEFPPDPFQRRAMDALAAGRSVVVAAPTGAGKTLVAEYGIRHALDRGARAVYTTPLKALSNQKYADFGRQHGIDGVGLLTGDHSIRSGAPVLVMTTEVLRNMLYADPGAVADVGVVVLDEVHYLQDPYRGGVWEEIIIHLPLHVSLVCLSATVSNAEEFAEWVETLRGDTEVVIEEERPIPLRHLYCVGERGAVSLLPMFADGFEEAAAERSGDAALEPAWLNPEIVRMERARSAKSLRGGRLRTPRRTEVVEDLVEQAMAPLIYFIFSRLGCDRAVGQLLDDGVRLTEAAERRRIRAIAEDATAELSDDDLATLGYGRWLAGLEAGLAAHHAGMVPPFKEAVERLFLAGLVKVVFATETLSLGVNMPARTVVVEKLTKFGGERHEPLTPGQYTQLAGRAGRRGIDNVGYSVVLWSPFVPYERVAALASARTYPLQSSFRPTYNMAANLVARFDRDTAHHVVNSSFAQFQVDRGVVRLEAQADRQRRALAGYAERAACDRGDVEEYRELAKAGVKAPRHTVSRRPVTVRPGDVVRAGRRLFVVLGRTGRGGRRYWVVGVDGVAVPLRHEHVDAVVARLDLPAPFRPQAPAYRKKLAAALRGRGPGSEPPPVDPAGTSAEATAPARKGALASHPCGACPDLSEHLRWAERAQRARVELARLERRIQGRAESLGRRFDDVCRFMEERGAMQGWALTPKGELLARIYSECDLVATEALWRGTLGGLTAPEVAAVVSLFTYEARREGPVDAPPTSAGVRSAVAAILRLAEEVREQEDDRRLSQTRPLDEGFALKAYDWTRGRPLDDVIEDALSGGDFVRNIKQLTDLCRQVDAALRALDLAPDVAASLGEAASLMWRGVVAATSVAE